MLKKGDTALVLGEKYREVFKIPQAIIHINHNISLQQYRYWLLLLQEFGEQFERSIEPDEKGMYAMSMARFSARIGYTPKKSQIWADLLALKNETIALNVLDKDGGRAVYGAGFLSEWSVSNSYVRFKLPSFLEEVVRGLDNPKAMFSLIIWKILNHFTGKHEAYIYMLCRDFIGVPHTPKMTIKVFREYMGIKSTEYPDFKKLNMRVISKSVKCINESEVSDIFIVPQFFTEGGGRKVTGLYFRVEYKKQTRLSLSSLDEYNPFRFAKMPIPPELRSEYLALPMSGTAIELCIERANEYAVQQEKKGKSVDYPRLYGAAIREGWHEDYAIVKAKREQKQLAKETERRQAIEADLTADQKARRLAEDNARAWSQYEALDEFDKHTLESDFLAQASELDLGLFRKQGRDAAVFKIFVRQQMLAKQEYTE